MSDEKPGNRGQLKTFGRTGGRPLSARQQALFDTLLPTITCPIAADNSLSPASLFDGAPREIWFEIGTGGGEHLTGQASRHSDIGMIGVEPFIEGVGKTLSQIDDGDITNVRLHQGDARQVLAGLKDAQLDRILILFPDPWPKSRHRKRRIVQQDTIELFASKLKPGGRLRFATDVIDYADWALERFLKSPSFEWLADSADDWRKPPQDHLTTRYQTKNLGDCAPVFYDFKRLAD